MENTNSEFFKYIANDLFNLRVKLERFDVTELLGESFRPSYQKLLKNMPDFQYKVDYNFLKYNEELDDIKRYYVYSGHNYARTSVQNVFHYA